MKLIRNIVLVAFAAVSLLAFADGYDDDYVTVRLPTTISMKDTKYNLGGTILTIKGVAFLETDENLNEAMSAFGNQFEALYSEMVNTYGLSASVASANMTAWSTYWTQQLFQGLAAQQEKEREDLDKIKQQANDEIKKAGQAADLSATRMSSLNTIFSAQHLTVIGKAAALASAVAQELSEKSKDLNDKMQELENAQKSGADKETIAALQTQVTEIGAKVAECESAQKTFNDKLKTLESQQTELTKSISSVQTMISNDFNNVTLWLGFDPNGGDPNGGDGDRALIGKFQRPFKSDGEQFTEANNVLDFIDDRWHLTNIMFTAVGGVTNLLYSKDGFSAVMLGVYKGLDEQGLPTDWIDAENGGGVTGLLYNVDHGLTNHFTSVINVANGFDDASVWTNDEKLVEIKGFHLVENDADVDYYPSRVYNADEGKAQIEWNTNSIETIKVALGIKKEIPKSQRKTWRPTPTNIDLYFIDNSIMQKVYGNTGMVERLNAAINVDNAYDNASVWTNGEAKVEIKGFHDKTKRKSSVDVPVRFWKDETNDAPDELAWFPMSLGDANMEDPEDEEDSIETKQMYDIQGNSFFMHGLYGFGGTGRKTGSVPYETKGGTSRALAWADPPDGVTADAPKVLTFDGSTVSWGDGSGATNEITVVTDVSYDPQTYTFTKKTCRVKVVFIDGEVESETTVFEAKPRSDR